MRLLFAMTEFGNTHPGSFPPPRKRSRIAIACAAFAFALGAAFACQVPVFRYALERWEPDSYEVVVVGADLLDPAQREVLEFLGNAPLDREMPANLRVAQVNSDATAEAAPAPAPASADKLPDLEMPRLELYYPGRLREFLSEPFWTGKVTMENARKIVHSPMRTEIVRRILQGDSATWLLVESGNKEKDDAAEQKLVEFSGDAEETLKIPDGVIGANEVSNTEYLSPSDAENVLTSDVPLKIAFSVVRLSREDPQEEVLLGMLLSVEDDLGEYANEPIAFPVFGRGRILEPLIGAGLTRDNVLFDSSYLCGACSCQVKEQNPGIDLLVAAAWDAALSGSQVIMEKVLPPLEGAGSLVEAVAEAVAADAPAAPAAATSDVAAAVAAATPGKASSSEGRSASPLRVLAIVMGVVVLGVVAVSMKLKRSSS